MSFWPETGGFRKYGAAVLCGGQSRRMGFDKSVALRDRRGGLLLAALAEELAGRFGEVALVTNDPAKLAPFPELSEYRILADLHPGAGPAGAIHTALSGLPGKALFIMACDMPVIDWAVIGGLRELVEARGADVAVPRHGRRVEPLCAFYGPAAGPVFAAGLAGGLRKVRLFYGEMKTVYLDLPDESVASGVFDNLNTPADSQKYMAALPPQAD